MKYGKWSIFQQILWKPNNFAKTKQIKQTKDKPEKGRSFWLIAQFLSWTWYKNPKQNINISNLLIHRTLCHGNSSFQELKEPKRTSGT